MKTILIWSICCLLFMLFSCRKKEDYISTWTIKGERFSEKADASIGKAIAILSTLSSDNKNYFDLSFYLGELPKEDIKTQWLMVSHNPNQNPWVATLYFYFNDVYYYLSPNQSVYLISSDNKGKAKYVLNGAWFINSSNTEDSTFVTATLVQP